MQVVFYKVAFFIALYIILLASCSKSPVFPNSDIDAFDDSEGKTIKITAIYYDPLLKKYVDEFNAKNNEYTVEVKAFVEELPRGTYNFNNDVAKLSTEIIAGNIPDIIVNYNSLLPIQSYVNKGLLADIYEFMESDPNFNKEDYLQSTFTAAERGGKLYEVFPMFIVHTAYAKSAEVGELNGWSLDDFSEYIATKPTAKYIIGGFTEEEFIKKMIAHMFTDSQTGGIALNRAELLKLFQVAKRFPSNYDMQLDFNSIQLGMSEGDPIMCYNLLHSPRDVRLWEKAYAGEEITFIGLPQLNSSNERGEGSSFFADVNFSVMKDAKEKEGAFEFIKFILDRKPDAYDLGIPVKLSHIDYMLEEAKRNPSNSGGKEYYVSIPLDIAEGTSYDIPVGNNTDEDNAKFMKFISSVNHIYRYDFIVETIIGEEIGAYLSGQKTSEQAIDTIENRINLYISEMS
ncbi:MAG: extracellular solute-binding protein [Oscillospiraceae bacterium]|nr:extracellular solute-binding protein [Oscillospiraceae bacterium]